MVSQIKKVIEMKKGQSMMEYLMTYGWAILIVIVVLATLFVLSVLKPEMSDSICRAAGGVTANESCCLNATDYPNTLIGVCGSAVSCVGNDTHIIQVCQCLEGKFWSSNSRQCVAR